MNFKINFIDKERFVFDIESVSKDLENLWMSIIEIKDHPFHSFAVAIYKNNDFEPGTIIVSKYFYHKYPDLYVVYNKENRTSRLYTNPKYRKSGYWKYFAPILRNFFYFNLNIYSDFGTERSWLAHKMYLGLRKIILEKNNFLDEKYDKSVYKIMENFTDKDVPRDPCFPNIWYNQRIGGVLNSE